MKILIVEDDHHTAELMASRLRLIGGIEIFTANTILDAMRIMSEENPPPDMVFLDVFLPDSHDPESTFAYINKMKAIHPDAFIFVMTGLPADSIRDKAMASGADAFEFKHSIDTQKALLNAMLRLFSRKSAGKERAQWLVDVMEQITHLVSPIELATPPVE